MKIVAFGDSTAEARVLVRWAAVLCVVIALAGCGGEDAEAPAVEPAAGQVSAALAYPPALSEKSSPRDVAQVLIGALEANEKGTLAGLVAVKSATKEIEAIYRRHGRKSPMNEEKAAALAVSGWRATYSFLQAGETRVAEERITGEKAEVLADGKTREGKPCRLKVVLVREDGLWRVRAGLESLPGGG